MNKDRLLEVIFYSFSINLCNNFNISIKLYQDIIKIIKVIKIDHTKAFI